MEGGGPIRRGLCLVCVVVAAGEGVVWEERRGGAQIRAGVLDDWAVGVFFPLTFAMCFS